MQKHSHFCCTYITLIVSALLIIGAIFHIFITENNLSKAHTQVINAQAENNPEETTTNLDTTATQRNLKKESLRFKTVQLSMLGLCSLLLLLTASRFMRDLKTLQQNEKELLSTNQQLRATEQQLLTSNKQFKTAEANIKKERDFAQNLIETAQVIIVVLDLDGIITAVNPCMEKISGYKTDDLIGKDWFSTFLSEPDRDSIREEFKASVNDIQTRGHISPMLTQGGQELLIEWYDKTLRNDKDDTIGLLAIGLDVTDKIKSEKGLAKSEEQYRTLFENTNEGILIAEISTMKFKYTNPAMCQMLGYTENELIDMPISSIYPEESLDRIKHDFKTQAPGKKAIASDIPCQKKDGSTLFVDMKSISMMLDDKLFNVGFFTNIEERKLAKQQKEQLIQADKMIAFGTLVSGIAHEINNPANFITLNAPILSDVWSSIKPVIDTYYKENGDFIVGGLNYSEMRENIPELLEGISEGSDRIRNIVSDLKEYVRPGTDDMSEAVDINKVLKSAIRLLNNQIHKLTQNFSVSYDENIPHVRGNSQKLGQVLINLVQNSCQALENPQQSVKIKTYSQKNDKTVVIEVEDTGVGISKDNMRHITDPFFTTKRNSGGTGMGLAVSSSIIKDHNGVMSFNSIPGKKTVAKITLQSEE